MSEDSRESGVDLGGLKSTLSDLEYPISQDDLLAEHGEETVELSNDDETATLEALIGPLNEDEYRNPGEVEGAIMSMVGDEAIGRKNYSDRTPPAPGEDRQDEGAPGQENQREQESF